MIEVKGNKFLVTGGAGFVGSHIVEELWKQGKEIVVIDSLVNARYSNVKPFLDGKRSTLYAGTVVDYERIRPLFDGVDVVFHNAASKCTVCRDDPRADLMINALGSYNVFEAARNAGVKKIVHASSGSVHGEVLDKQYGHHEEAPLKPVSFYGVSKLAGESYLRAFDHYYPDFRYTVLRYYHVYGPRQDWSDKGGVVPIFIRNAWEGKPFTIFGDGTQTRSFTYVKDVVEANFHVANEPRTDGSIYNVASGMSCPLNYLARMIHEMAQSNPPMDISMHYEPWRPGDIKDFNVRINKLAKAGYRCPTALREGLQKTIDWYAREFSETEAPALS